MKALVRLMVPFLLVLFICVSVSAAADKPGDVIRKAMDQAIKIMNDPNLQGEGNSEKLQEEIWKVIKPMFDYIEISKRTLARNWKKFSRDQRKEFTDSFIEVLKNTYLSQLKSEYKDVKINVVGENLVSENKAQVNTRILRQDLDVPVDFRMVLKKDQWRVYDVVIEGVSMVKNYRTQFNELLNKETPDQLIARLKTKIEKQKQGADTDDKV
ncbi:MAG: ABC transporter substrate-binding protein [Desulfobacterales bacterium]|nr:ABC transporter substrate-binding protein [Desulfobacterales bacterium]